MHSRLAYLPAAILLGGSALLWHARSQVAVPLAGSLDSVLPTVEGYHVTNQTLTDEERRVAGMTDYRARAFVKDSAVIFTTLVSYYSRQTQGKTIHSPKNCLPGAGWEIVRTGTQELEVDGARHTVNSNVLRNGSTSAVVYYWYQGRGRVTANEYGVKWNLLRDAALLGHTEEALVRVVVPVALRTASTNRVDEQNAMHRAESIAADISTRLIREVGAVVPRRSHS